MRAEKTSNAAPESPAFSADRGGAWRRSVDAVAGPREIMFDRATGIEDRREAQLLSDAGNIHTGVNIHRRPGGYQGSRTIADVHRQIRQRGANRFRERADAREFSVPEVVNPVAQARRLEQQN